MFVVHPQLGDLQSSFVSAKRAVEAFPASVSDPSVKTLIHSLIGNKGYQRSPEHGQGQTLQNVKSCYIASKSRSVPQSLENTKDTELDTLRQTLLEVRARIGELVLLRIPGHSNTEGNEKADNLVKIGARRNAITYLEEKTMIRMTAGNRWTDHESFNRKDDFCKLGTKNKGGIKNWP
ncbi:hypothetical protein ElyMa_004465200 [Elysia marginata]|uniref:RNase H type-1 domain-containing protein n=1 Tax=Elysia marginata TaxID=1093978 RepID=A0AAV4HGH3_9GAST|nr:hypothetical protein ElyMa_004465200 [Elysia marginata]